MEITKNNTHPGKVIKYCPKCGSASFIYDGEKSFKCHDCQFHFFINSACAVAVIICNNQGDILFTRRAVEPQKGMLDLPGGFVDPLENAEESVVREVKEELNLDVVSMQYIASYPNDYVFSGFSVFTTDLCFLCEVKSFEQIHAKDDISGYEFIHPGDVDFKEIGSDSIKNIVRDYIRTISNDLD